MQKLFSTVWLVNKKLPEKCECKSPPPLQPAPRILLLTKATEDKMSYENRTPIYRCKPDERSESKIE
jgi:hypothetical protein